MKPGPLGIYYFSYSERVWPRSARKMLIGVTKDEILERIAEKEIPEDWFCWLEECRTPGFLVEGKRDIVLEWITNHMPLKFKEPLRDQDSP